MVNQLTFTKSTYKQPPLNYEAGTPNIINIIGFSETIKFLTKIDFTAYFNYEKKLMSNLINKLNIFKNLVIVGTISKDKGVLAFYIPNINVYNCNSFLGLNNIYIRAGYHCCHPLLKRFCNNPTLRLSFGLYNTSEDIDTLVTNLFTFYKKLV